MKKQQAAHFHKALSILFIGNYKGKNGDLGGI